jgi:hypothetical protein
MIEDNINDPVHLVADANLEPSEDQQEQEQVQQNEPAQPPQYPVSTLVQSVGNRPFEISLRTIHNLQLLILTFPRGLTLLMAATDANRPAVNGAAQLDVHRKFLPAFEKYLHWITFTFPTTGTKVQAQIMLANRLEAACNLIQGGACACFLNSPFRQQRRAQPSRRRILASSR